MDTSLLKMLSNIDRQISPLNNTMDIVRQIQKSTESLRIPKHIYELAYSVPPPLTTYLGGLDIINSIKTPALNSTMDYLRDLSQPAAYLENVLAITKSFQSANTMNDWLQSYSKLTDLSFGMKPLNVGIPQSFVTQILALDDTFRHVHKLTNLSFEYSSIANIIGSAISIDAEELDEDEQEEIGNHLQMLVSNTKILISNAPATFEAANEFLNNFIEHVFQYFEEHKVQKALFLSLILPLLTNLLSGYFQNISSEPAVINNYYITQESTNKIQVEPITIGDLIINSKMKEVRREPRKDYKIIYVLPIGSEITIIKKTRKWAMISYCSINGMEGSGWVILDGLDN